MNAAVQQVVDEGKQDVTVMAGAVTVINGISGMIATAVNAAIANGATADELAPVSDVAVQLANSRNALAQAIASVPGQQPADPTTVTSDVNPNIGEKQLGVQD